MQGYGEPMGARMTRFWGRLSQWIAVLLPLLATLDRFRRPTGDKFVFPHLNGSADLWLPYLGARAIVAHLDPYGPLPAYLLEPSGWPSTYPPTMLALYVPLVWATGSNVELACQVFYWINIVALGALSIVTWRLSIRLVDPRDRADSSFLVMLIALSLNGLTMFALDRGQSEIVSAALCWGAILLFLRGEHGWSMAAITLAGAIKGYAVPVGIGLLLATRGKKQVLRGLGAAAAVSLAVTVPVAQYLEHGFSSMLVRADFSFIPVWFNHSFKNAFFQFSEKLGDSGRRWMLVLTAVTMLGSLWRLIVAKRKGTKREIAARAVVFAGTALALAIGLPVYSAPYNYVLVLPAMLLVSTRFPDFVRLMQLRQPLANVLGLVLVSALALALRLRWFDHQVTLAGVALVAFVICMAVLATARPRASA